MEKVLSFENNNLIHDKNIATESLIEKESPIRISRYNTYNSSNKPHLLGIFKNN